MPALLMMHPLQPLVAALHEPCLVLDGRGCVVAASGAFHAAFGVPEGEACGRPLFELCGGAWDVPPLRVLLEVLARERERVEGYQVEVTLPGMGPRVVSVNLHALGEAADGREGYLLALRDATEPRGEPLPRIETDHANELVTVHELDGSVQYASSSAEPILGYTPDELRSTGFLPLVHPEDEQEFETFFHAVRDGGRSEGLAYRVRTRCGEVIWLGSSARPVRGPDGEVSQLQIVSRDISERKEAEEALRHSRWLAGIGQTVLTLRHEINNPLTSMLADAALLEMEGNTPEEEREMVRSIVRQARRIRDVVHRLAAQKDAPALRRVGSAHLLDLSDAARGEGGSPPS